MRTYKTYLAVFILVLFLFPEASAAPTAEEATVFFAERRQEKADFDRGILAETDSRLAATEAFNRQGQADRAAFTRSLPAQPSQDDLQSLNDFNTAMVQKQRDFKARLPALPKSKFEKAIEDFDKKALSDRDALNAELAAADPQGRSEKLRQFQNTLLQERLKLKKALSDDISKKRNQFKQSQAQKVSSFFT